MHVCFHLKKVDDLEIYEICQPSKDKLEEVCDLRQPVVTEFTNDNLTNSCNFNNIKANYSAHDIKIRNIKEYDDETELYECKDPVEIGTTNRVVGLNDLAGSIKTQFLADPTKGSSGNPFTHTISDS